MNLLKTNTLEAAVDNGYPVYVVYKSDSKEIVDWYIFGEKMAENSSKSRNNKFGPETHEYAEWAKYMVIRERHAEHMADVNAEWRKR